MVLMSSWWWGLPHSNPVFTSTTTSLLFNAVTRYHNKRHKLARSTNILYTLRNTPGVIKPVPGKWLNANISKLDIKYVVLLQPMAQFHSRFSVVKKKKTSWTERQVWTCQSHQETSTSRRKRSSIINVSAGITFPFNCQLLHQGFPQIGLNSARPLVLGHIVCASIIVSRSRWDDILFSSLPFQNAWQEKDPEYKSQLIWQVQRDVWHSHYVLFPSLIKRSRVTMGVGERAVGRLRQNRSQIKLTG